MIFEYQKSVIEILKVFKNFSKISSLKLNKSKCKIAGTGNLKGVSGTLQHAMHQLKQRNC